MYEDDIILEIEDDEDIELVDTSGTDVSLDTATPADVIEGKTFHTADGEPATGTYTLAAHTQATSAAEDIAYGKTAWVNGELVTGTYLPTLVEKDMTGPGQYIAWVNSKTLSAGESYTGGQEIDTVLIPDSILITTITYVELWYTGSSTGSYTYTINKEQFAGIEVPKSITLKGNTFQTTREGHFIILIHGKGIWAE